MLTIPVDDFIHLRLLEMSHAPALFRLVASNRDHLRPWLPWVDRMRVENDAENYILRSLGRYSTGTEAHFGIWFHGMLAGSITVERIDAWNRVAEIGYWLGREFVGRGIMRRSTAALIDYLIDRRAINRIEIRCTTANVSSQSIPLRLGFRMEGTLHQAAYLMGRFHDHLLFAITADEWKRRKQGGGAAMREPAAPAPHAPT
ncbi:ribosomal-protein-serine acetyltransferase [Planifilum fimeticola]|uniref:Ribosomal-protein-serine acetyltransferase n=1 Tax=Planifilum fimeticola TaxID=201975 RepID=A0A2T0LJI8_9BACL|nr:GNAT family N-acetyltransferase [Planifilum fimeticola]PRX42673.1 ribosomal-protein-serine acetyltransferase [Planifilum fimeticola]